MRDKLHLRSIWCALVLGACLRLYALEDVEPFSVSAVFVVDTAAGRVDTDGDGMPDDYELAVGLNRFINDANSDNDGDGISNLQEYNAGTSPTVADFPQLSQNVSAPFVVSTRANIVDTDGDGMPDDWELAHGLNRFVNDASGDVDGDGLTNIQEYNSGTDPQSNDSATVSTGVSALFTVNTALYAFSLIADTDGDGMPDWWEQKYGLNPSVNDANTDLDGDGISNLTEFQRGQNPIANESLTEVASVSAAFVLNTQDRPADTDGDGIPDTWEIAHGLNPSINDAAADTDGDGRSNLDEYNAGTDPQVDDWRGPTSAVSALFLADTGGFPGPRSRDRDEDGMPDWWEVQYGLNGDVNDASGDLDGDGISNLQEFNSGSSPVVRDGSAVIGVSAVFLVDTGGRSFDTDGDGIPDWWEKLYFNDPRAASPLADNDGDGHNNYSEYVAGSNPLDANSATRLSVQATQQTNGAIVTLRWVSFEGTTYSIWAASVVQGPYVMLATNIVASPPLNTRSVAVSGSNAFFRIGVAR